jgi:hypothetical protein
MEIEDLKKAFEKAKTKKISVNINEKTLDMIDELAAIPGMTRTQMIDALVSAGFVYETEFLEKSWKKFLKDKKYIDKKDLLNGLLGKLGKFKEKWHVEEIPLPD